LPVPGAAKLIVAEEVVLSFAWTSPLATLGTFANARKEAEIMTQPQLDLIDLEQDLPGQQRFISCWVSRQADLTFIVDPGPKSSIPHLLAQLQALGVDHLDLVLLTHVHLDHAGGTAEVIEAFPGARVVCHDKGVPHLIEPARLWQGSLQVQGRMAEVYGRPSALPPEAIATPEQIERQEISVLETPGHASHHLSFLHCGTLYAGEAAGTYMALPEERAYLRPSTPPKFFLPPALASLDLLLSLTPEPQRIAFSHYGLVEGSVRSLLQAARQQLVAWTEVARQERRRGAESFAANLSRTLERLIAEDALLAGLAELEPAIRQREHGFAAQTLHGIFGWLEREARS
jgi:glyoxylase-like metal-dependent hydrolase (beta-lactamase superfamily II)